MKRLLPAPWTSAVLFLVWPMLNASWSLGQLLLGAALALAIPPFTDALRPDKPALRHPLKMARLVLVVLWDILSANIEVAQRILGPEAAIHPRFVWLPLRLTDAHGVVALAAIVAMTPGTLSAEISEDRRHLLIHALSVHDEAALIATIQARYEAPLCAIFEGADR